MNKNTTKAFLAALFFSFTFHASALITITVDEHGNGNWDGAPLFPAGLLLNDPGPGGLPNALTYFMGNANPPFGQTIATVATGDLLVRAPGSGTLLELMRFRPGNVMTFAPGAIVWYSANNPGPDTMADIGFPTSQNANRSLLLDPGFLGGERIIEYTPTPGQPGYVDDLASPGNAAVRYRFISQIPEPATAAMTGAFALLLLGARHASRRR